MKNLKIIKTSDTSLVGYDKSLELICSHAYLVDIGGAKWRLLNHYLGYVDADKAYGMNSCDGDIQYQKQQWETE